MSTANTFDIGTTADNSFINSLRAEWLDSVGGNYSKPHEVREAHFSFVHTAKFENPYLIAVSADCAATIGIDGGQLNTSRFVQAFCGNVLLPGLDKPYASVYGCHCYGTWFGQLGDGRAICLGEVMSPSDGRRYELQLKGAGRTPYSRGFDGKAVLRSCVREFLASEAMHHLGVPTTRALSVVGTGETVLRAWYADNTQDRKQTASSTVSYPHPPQLARREPGAVMCRVSPSYLRFSHIELFAERKEYRELVQIVDHAIFREFAHLESIPCRLTRYVQLFREIMQRNVRVVCEWDRVGYVQGNMNSDNTMLAGRTLDYGPYGMMERYDPYFQPFTSDADKKFCFSQQSTAIGVNISVLGDSFALLIKYVHKELHDASETNGAVIPLALDHYLEELRRIATTEFQSCVEHEFSEMRRRKLGLSNSDNRVLFLWKRLDTLMQRTGVDYVIFFRLLSHAICDYSPQKVVDILNRSAYNVEVLDNESLRRDWEKWFTSYIEIIQEDVSLTPMERENLMNSTNPKYILRNWMAAMAYESAEEGNYELINKLLEVLSHPYEEGSDMDAENWFRKTPPWAQHMPGVSFMS
eukprot:CAMPEP_0185029834 /NCGR_PEP_ID=MMETSP1103-20130426/16399_1 /TAXON_ID=36769 /ORGANISM="Paraphysomonas bandaiensis, Strain Caron Lab Isolate" /LENGTH=582 /DNA_ID=CAMNT_0027564733 /DNA_START=97 /DNA_END=1845 /DNA_ORIENTATION=+